MRDWKSRPNRLDKWIIGVVLVVLVWFVYTIPC